MFSAPHFRQQQQSLSEALNRAFAAYNKGKLSEAEKLCREILAAKHESFDALNLLAVIQLKVGRIDDALASFDRVLVMQPDHLEARNNRGLVLQELKRLDEALASYDRALTVQPDFAEALYNRGNTLQELERFDEALASYDRALVLRPDYAEVLFNRGGALQKLTRFDEALASYDGALAVRPDHAKALNNRGIVLMELKRRDEALASYDRALNARPDYVEAHWNEGLLRLLTGDFSRGWVKHEWRWKNESLALLKRNFAQPLWLGEDAIDGKTVLLHSEQGFGDTIQFCRYVPLVAACGARVILEVAGQLQELMSSLAGATQVISRGNPLPDFDLQCPLLSLPLAFGTRLETIPSTTPYLQIPVQALKAWQERLGPKTRPRIGLVWSGNAAHKNDKNRSIDLRSLLPLLDIEATFVSLQKDVRTADAAVLKEHGDILQFGDALKDFSDTAALISHMDLVISVDTSVAHLAGALGKPVWVLLTYIPDWRWLLDRDDSPWYPTARLFRQDDTRTWDSVIEQVHAALGDFVGNQNEKQQQQSLPEALNRAFAAYNKGKLSEAEKLCQAILAAKHDFFDALHVLAVVQASLGKNDLALASYDRALTLRPESAEVLSNRGNILRELKRFEEALASYDKALALKPDYADALNNRGAALMELKRFDEALTSYDRALTLRSDFAEALYNRGSTLKELKRFDEALASYDRALAVRPDHARALNNRGIVLMELKRFDEALASYDRALAVRPDHARALNNRGIVLVELKRFDEALASYDKALALKPDYAEALNSRGAVLEELKRFDEALASYDSALAVQPDHAHAFNGAADCVIKLCYWHRRFAAELDAHVSKQKSIIAPFVLLGYSSDPAMLLQCARNFISDKVPLLPRPLWTGATWHHDKVRIAYLSADFHPHATAYLMAELFELHDRSRFDIIGVSFGGDDKSEVRKRLVAAFDQFHDVSSKSDEEVARLLHDLQVDIAVDLKGYTQESRPGILAHRPTPIQANYLAFPGTMAVEFIDYIIADKTVAPFEQQPFFTEKIVHLPDCYQVNDSKRKIAERTPTRQEAGLPGKGLVFCCFNNSWKITPDVFSVWMRLLHAIEGSVLWLLRDNEGAEQNLRKEAEARGIDPSRLIFAGRVPLDEHLARHRLAHLFLDTLPYNAHTTASDALWAGLPLLTCKGETFAGRVAASLLKAIGLPELVTHSIEDYEALALRLASDPILLEGYRNRLAANRMTHPLFDTERFRRHIEAAYLQMWEIWQRGEQPRSFAVEAERDDKIFLENASGTHNRPAAVHLGVLVQQAVAAFGTKNSTWQRVLVGKSYDCRQAISMRCNYSARLKPSAGISTMRCGIGTRRWRCDRTRRS
jgi:predicted O-linked N-acetylglucosamine transferase (SPINDLY family)